MLSVSTIDDGPARPGFGYLEYPLGRDPDSYPVLVSSTRSLLWIWKPPKKSSVVRTGVRHTTLETLYTEAILAIADMGIQLNWGNVQKSLASAVAHVKSYGFTDVDILSRKPLEGQVLAAWVPEGKTLVLPKDRSAVGFAGLTGNGPAIIVTDPSRAVGIVV